MKEERAYIMKSDRQMFCQSGGCTAKLGPGALSHVLEKLPRKQDPDLLVGYDHSDDAAVYRISDTTALVQTLDFFPPMVEDPYLFGQIAAANALSDIYAMGGEVLTALNIVCFPENMDLNILGQILAGGNEKVREGGGVLAGGHTIMDEGIKYGLSVCGRVHPDRILTNHDCEAGDALLLTKPLGVGLTCTAARMEAVSGPDLELALESMRTLNRKASKIIRKYHTHACTDVTGFGFLGHLCEMMGGRLTAVIDQEKIPRIPGSESYAEEFYLTAAAQRNRNHLQGRVSFQDCTFAMEELLFDPQTSGGLLVSMAAEDAGRALKELSALGLPCGIVGKVTGRTEKEVIVR